MKSKIPWRGIAEVVGLTISLVAIFLTREQLVITTQQFALKEQELDLARQQFDYAQSLHPNLEYSVKTQLSENDQREFLAVADQLVDSFYDQITNNKRKSPPLSYLQVVNATLPMSRTLPASPVSAEVKIRNTGKTAATKVRVVISLDRPITSCNVESVGLCNIIGGEVGQKEITIEVDRIVADDDVTINIKSRVTEIETQRVN